MSVVQVILEFSSKFYAKDCFDKVKLVPVNVPIGKVCLATALSDNLHLIDYE